jgi:branched-subunit amino acid ABC-type transport system permease component
MLTTFLQAIGYGLVTSSVIALSAVALSLQWKVSNIPNFAHGEFLTVGAYGAMVAQVFTDNLAVDAALGIALAAAVAAASNIAFIEPFLRRKANITTLFVVTIGISLIVQNVITLAFGAQVQTYSMGLQQLQHIGPFLWTTPEILVMTAAGGVMLGLHLLLQYTSFGRALRAVSDDRQLARACGIDTGRVVNLTWLLAGGIAGLGGFTLAASSGSFDPGMGFGFLLVTFAAAVIGGIGRPYGAMGGALIVGIATELSAAYLSSGYKQVIAVGLLILFLLLRPAGLFSRET